MTHSIQERTIVLSNGKLASFPYPIADAIDFDDAEVVAVRLKIPPKGQFNENIFGVDFDGSIRWQIPEVRHVGPDSPYTAMRRVGSHLEADNWDGLVLTVEPKTGVILRQNYQK